MGKPVVTKGIPELNKKLDGLIKFIKSPRQAFKDSELIMHSDILRHFQREQGPHRKWLKSKRARLEGGKTLDRHGVAGLKGSFNAFSDSKQAGVGTNKKYARIHNEGLRVQRHKVTPRVKKALRWVAGGKVFFSKGHWIKAFKMPKRTFMYISKRGQDRIEARFIVHAEKA